MALTLDQAQAAIVVLQELDPKTEVRVSVPYRESLFCGLQERGYIVVVERTAWNEVEIVLSISNSIDESCQSK